MQEWVLVSPHRTRRPWQGLIEKAAESAVPVYDPECYLCPGNLRAGGQKNPAYASTFVFDNDFAALLPDTPECEQNERGLIVAQGEPGLCRVICFSPRHDLSIPRMKVEDIQKVVDVWAEQFEELGRRPNIRYVQIFENRGAMMGASNPHPHCQIWANSSLPNVPAKEQVALEEYRRARGSCLLCDYLELERAEGLRMVCESRHFAVMVPFWALWPFETLLIPRRHVAAIDELTLEERCSLAEILKRLVTRYDNLFEVPFPYSMGFHQRPCDGAPHTEWHFHLHFYPPLLRSATVRKFMVGYEMVAMPQRDITPEAAARRLQELSEIHYSIRCHPEEIS